MNRKVLITLILLVMAGTAFAVDQYTPVYPLHFGVFGKVLPAKAGDAVISPAGATAVLFKGDDPLTPVSAKATVDDMGNYVINAESNRQLDRPSGPFKIAVLPPPGVSYGVPPTEITISGANFQKVGDLQMQAYSPYEGAVPQISNIRFGNRLYQITESQPVFVVSPTPKMTADIRSDFGIMSDTLEIVINDGTALSRSLSIAQANMSITAQDAGQITAASINYTLSAENKLNDGANTVTFRGANAYGSTSEVATVTVMTGPLSVIGEVLPYPAPFSPRRHGNVEIQYTLSADGDVDLILISGAKQVVKKISCMRGAEGGMAGLNKVVWNGIMDTGGIVGNGIYAGVLTSRAEGRILARFMLTVVD